MNTLIFDLESNGFLDETHTIHCICIFDTVMQTSHTFNNQAGGRPIIEGVEMLNKADRIVGHNISGFDIPVLKKLFPSFNPRGQARDTMLLARLLWPDVKEQDFRNIGQMPKNLIGAHSLEAWGYRVGEKKGDFKKNNDFSAWTQEMEDYCKQDVFVTKKLWEKIMETKPSEASVILEHGFASVIQKQERHGFLFNAVAAAKLTEELMVKRAGIEDSLRAVFLPETEQMKSCCYVFQGKDYTTKAEADVDAKAWAKVNKVTQAKALALITKGANKTKQIPFNPGSREQVAERFIKQGWKPTEYAESGHIKIDEGVLSDIEKQGFKEAGPLLDYFLVTKRLGQIAEGNEAWMKAVAKDGRIHGRVITNGAVTGRCTHSKPNMGQVPNSSSKYGVECRSLFTVPKGKKLVGADASGLELRCLAHFMARYDCGSYASILLSGDIHTVNQQAAGLPTRNDAKTFIYAFLYGAGDAKIGSIIGKGEEEGRKIKREFLAKTPAIRHLRDAVEGTVVSRGHLIGLDGRILPIRSAHAALNALLQSAGAVAMKQATILLDKYLNEAGMAFGREYAFVAHVHDEMQLEVDEDKAERVGKLAVKAIRDAGAFFRFRCPLDGEYKVGNNWAETH